MSQGNVLSLPPSSLPLEGEGERLEIVRILTPVFTTKEAIGV
jgi:hypothetical protein